MDSRESYPALELVIDQLPGQESKVVDAINKTLDFLANHSYIMEWEWKNVVHEGKPSGKGDPRLSDATESIPPEISTYTFGKNPVTKVCMRCGVLFPVLFEDLHEQWHRG